MQGIGKERIKELNLRALLRFLLHREKVSQTDMQSAVGLKKATVSVLMASLKAQGLICEIGQAAASAKGGRKYQYVGLARKKIVASGFALRPGSLKCGLCDLEGSLLFFENIPVDCHPSSEWAPRVVQKAKALQKKAEKAGFKFLGAGFITGGIFDPHGNGFKGFSNSNEPFKSIPELFGDAIEAADDYPNGMAMGEMWFGSAQGIADFLYLQLKNLKATFVVDHKIYRGRSFKAGELWLTRAGARFSEDLKANGARAFTGKDFSDLISDLQAFYDPQTIIFSKENAPSGLVEEWDHVKALVDAPVRLSALGPDEGPKGAASMVFEKYFHSELSI